MIEDLFFANKQVLETPEIQTLLERIKHLENVNKELFKKIEFLKKNAEQLIVVAFAIVELRDHWRVKFDLPTKGDYSSYER